MKYYRNIQSHRDFYLFRHGETLLNVQNRCQGAGMNYDLTETGCCQARQLAKKLKDLDLQAIFSSPLTRAHHTARIAAAHLNIPIFIRNNLRECHYGEAEGKLLSEIKTLYPEAFKAWKNPCAENLTCRFPDGESMYDTLHRLLNTIDNISRLPYNTAGLAIHGGSLNALMYHFGLKSDSIPNCAVLHLARRNGVWTAPENLF